MIVTEENRSTWKNLSVNATTNPMWAGFGMKPGFHIERPIINCLSHGKTLVDVMVSNINPLTPSDTFMGRYARPLKSRATHKGVTEHFSKFWV
jgi:hypothetical protein